MRSRRKLGLGGLLIVVGLDLLPFRTSGLANACTPGQAGCMPEPDQCATGSYNGPWLGNHVGFAAVCVGAGGHNVVYVAGNALLLCGTVIAGDQVLVAGGDPNGGGDPNLCDSSIEPLPDQLRFRVQLPSDYLTSGKSYPVLYLLPGGGGDENGWFNGDPEIPALADQGLIIVSVYNGLGFYNDWRNGQHHFETIDTAILVPYIDSHFRTVADRAHRAIAGLSQGGYGATFFAARHPDLYVAAGSFSGAVDIASPIAGEAYFTAGYEAALATYQQPVQENPIWGNFVTDEVWWHGRNPTDLASNLRGTSLYVSVGDGIPGQADVTSDGPAVVSPVASEVLVRTMNDHFDSALRAAGIPHTYHTHHGIHDWPYWIADLDAWFPIMMSTFGTAAPAVFDYRSIDPSFSVWGWSVSADPSRALEFLDIRAASASGVTLVGSGLTHVTTGGLFSPGQTVRLSGARQASVTANLSGQISFDVDLGPAHQLQQYTVQERLAEAVAAGSYFMTRTVTFVP